MTTVEAPAATERECVRCGSPAGPLQEYCLECGARLPTDPAAQRPGSWIWPVAVTALVALAAGAVIAVPQWTTDEQRPLLVATTEQPSVPVTTAEEPVTLGEPAPVTTTAPPPTTTAPPPPPPNRVTAWPAGTRGWTVVLASVDAARGRATAAAQAREAVSAGLGEVGVLRSDEYSSLHPGFYVVFAGVYESRAQADEGARQARGRGYQHAYAREIVP